MKKLLLLCLFFAANTYAQTDFWTEYATSQPAASTGMRSISIVDANVTWLSNSCGTTGCTTIRRYSKTTDGGLTWTTADINLGSTSANLEIANICGLSADVAYASVFPKATSPGGIWKTIDGGTTWTKQATALFNDVDSFTDLVYFWDANNGVALGDPAGGYYEIYTTTDGGTTWVRTPSSPALIADAGGQDYGLTNQFTVTGNSIWVGTTYGKILKSTDHGYTWSIVQSPIADFGGGIHGTIAGDMAFSDEMNGLLQTNDYQLFSTTDGGATWNTVPYTGILRNFGLSGIPGLPNSYISVGEDLDTTTRGSSFSNDGGLTWVSINDQPDLSYVQGSVVAFLNSTTGFASGFSSSLTVGGIYKWNGNPLLATTAFSNDKQFNLAPNPTTGIFSLSGNNITHVMITDVLGKEISNTSYSAINNVSVDISSYKTGVYMVKVTNNLGNVSTIKVIKN
jgi:photosystem II stability/assembly factor-like uncharacterized protein